MVQTPTRCGRCKTHVRSFADIQHQTRWLQTEATILDVADLRWIKKFTVKETGPIEPTCSPSKMIVCCEGVNHHMLCLVSFKAPIATSPIVLCVPCELLPSSPHQQPEAMITHHHCLQARIHKVGCSQRGESSRSQPVFQCSTESQFC